MTNTCADEVRMKNFGFDGVSPQAFQQLQWSRNPWLLFLYRLGLLLYVFIWFIYDRITIEIPCRWCYLSYWTEGLVISYVVVSFLIACHTLVMRRRRSNIPESKEACRLRWYYIMCWLLFNMAAVLTNDISILFWTVISPKGKDPELTFRPYSINLHTGLAMLMLVDVFFVAFPVRFLHFVYTVMFCLSYGVYIGILHLTGITSAVYPVLDFQANPGLAVSVILATGCVESFAFHTFFYGLYRLRAFIARRVLSVENEKPQDPSFVALSPSSI